MKIFAVVSVIAFVLAGCSSSDPAAPPESTPLLKEKTTQLPDPSGGKKDQAATAGKKEEEIVFRCEGGTETVYLVFRGDGTYSMIMRAHVLIIEAEKGSWTQDKDGQIIAAHDGAEDHFVPFSYGPYRVVTSPDHTLVRIFTPTPERAMALIDEKRGDSPIMNVFLEANADQSREEWKTSHPFLLFPEMNKGQRPQPVLLKK